MGVVSQSWLMIFSQRLENIEKDLHLVLQLWDEYHNFQSNQCFEMIRLGFGIHTLEVYVRMKIGVCDSPYQ